MVDHHSHTHFIGQTQTGVASSIALLSRAISARECSLDRATMDPDPEPLGDQLNKIRRAQRRVGREPLTSERKDLVGQLMRARRTRARWHQPGQPACVKRSGRFIERRAREPELLR